MKHRVALVFVLSQLAQLALVEAQQREHWVATWTTAQDLARVQPPPAPAPPPATPATPPAPAQAPPPRPSYSNRTVRMIVRTSIAGSRVRIKLANAFGAAPVVVGAAHIAVRFKDSEIVPESDRALTFNGKPGCTIGDGMVMVSDPVDLKVPALGDLAVSLYIPGETTRPTSHGAALGLDVFSLLRFEPLDAGALRHA